MKVSKIIENAMCILMEEGDGIRWKKGELLNWLQEAYGFIVLYAPESNAITQPFVCEAGSKQEIPNDGVKLIDVVSNLGSSLYSISTINKGVLSDIDRNWRSATQSNEQEFFVFDELNPKVFYVYPPALGGSELEIIYSAVPSEDVGINEEDNFKFDDRYGSIALDYILYRAFQKDSDAVSSDSRAQNHYRSVMSSLGVKIKNDLRLSPNKEG